MFTYTAIKDVIRMSEDEPDGLLFANKFMDSLPSDDPYAIKPSVSTNMRLIHCH